MMESYLCTRLNYLTMSISMKRILFLSLLMGALMLTRQNVWADGVAHVAFLETFNANVGTGGHDEPEAKFSGNIASSNLVYDQEGWIGNRNSNYVYGGLACMRFGNNDNDGSCITPEIVLIGTGKTATLTFKAAGWASSGTNTLTVTANEGVTLSGDTQVTLTNSSWSSYTVNITLTTAKSVRLTFTGRRGFLDDVKVEENVTAINAPMLSDEHFFWANTTETATENITLVPSDSTTVYYTTDGTEPSEQNGSVATLTSNVIITGTTMVKAKAYYKTIASSVVSKTYTVGSTVNGIAAFCALADDTEARLFFSDDNVHETRVLYYDASRHQVFLRDETGALCIDLGTTATFNPIPQYNQHVAGWIVGRKTTENGLPKLVATNNTTTDYLAFANRVTEAQTEPNSIGMDDVSSYKADWVKLTKQRVGTDITVIDRLGTASYDGALADLSGIVIPDNTVMQIAPFTQNGVQGVVYVLDETQAFVSPSEDLSDVSVRLERTLGKDYWNTFSVPFDITIQDAVLREYDHADGNVMVFQNAVSVVAGKPYLVKPAANIENPTFDHVTLSATNARTITSGDYSFVASYSPVDLNTDKTEMFLKSDGKLYFPSSTGAHLRGMRAFFRVPTGQTARLAVSDDGMVTGVNALNSESEVKDEVFNLSGQRVKMPKKGLYIISSNEARLHGKNKIIIR